MGNILWNKIVVTYGITVCNEAEELQKLMDFLLPAIDGRDEVLILSDKPTVTPEVLGVIERVQKSYPDVKHISYPLDGNFANFKNHLIEHASGDYLFQIDADEIPAAKLIKNLKRQLFFNRRYDMILVPRVNYVVDMTPELSEKWELYTDAKGRINYPDLQTRIFRLGRGIKWENKVHEKLVNWKHRIRLPYKKNEDYCLFHVKSAERQDIQHEFYKTL